MGIFRKIVKSPITVTKWCAEAAVIGGATGIPPPLGLGMIVGKNIEKMSIKKKQKEQLRRPPKKPLKRNLKN